jgi:hypothetical protein
MKAIGHKVWAIAGGHIPPSSIGHEPECTSRDELFVLNAARREARMELTIYYTDREPVGPYKLKVAAQRVRRVRFNDLIDPEAMPLDVDYGVVIRANVPIVVQFSRLDTSQPSAAIASTMAFPVT